MRDKSGFDLFTFKISSSRPINSVSTIDDLMKMNLSNESFIVAEEGSHATKKLSEKGPNGRRGESHERYFYKTDEKFGQGSFIENSKDGVCTTLLSLEIIVCVIVYYC